MKNIGRSLIAALAAFAIFGSARLSATPITLGASELLGSIKPGTPANSANATAQVLFLVNAYNLGTPNATDLGDNPADPQQEDYILYRPTAAPNQLNNNLSSAGQVVTSNPVVDLGGTTYQYILFFQASDAWVYYIGNIAGSNSITWGGDPYSTDSNVDGSQISHYELFNGTSVPDGGSTIAMLGGVLLGLAVIRRRFAR